MTQGKLYLQYYGSDLGVATLKRALFNYQPQPKLNGQFLTLEKMLGLFDALN